MKKRSGPSTDVDINLAVMKDGRMSVRRENAVVDVSLSIIIRLYKQRIAANHFN